MQREQRRKRTKKITHKLGVIVPYRNRPQQLKRFLKHMGEYLTNLDYQIFIIEQSDDKPFNRGKLLNVGYTHAIESGCDYFVFHDVDMLPEDVDYSYTDKPLHLATHLQEHDYETTFFDYFGGVTMFNKEDFELINGFSNEYWGWGFEDDDLLIRCLDSNLELDKNQINTGGSDELQTFKFNGDSFIKLEGKKTTLLQDDFTISCLVKPQKVKLNENKDYDEFPIISIPGYNIGLFYNSFRRFFCQTYDVNKKPYSINSDIIGEAWVYLTMRYRDGKFVSFFVNGELVETIEMDELLKKSDFVTLHVPKIGDKPLISAEKIGLMKNGSGLINTSRGGLVDETALMFALDKEKLAYAGLDVFENEPNPSIHLLMHNAISMTPHIGAATNEAQDRIGIELADQIISFFKK